MGGESPISAIAERIECMPGLSEESRRQIAWLLLLACNFGAGDAMAGKLLAPIPAKTLDAAAKVLRISFVPQGGGPAQALELLGKVSVYPEITKLLQELNVAASTKGMSYW